MARLQNPESQATYAGYYVKFVCYFLRIIADEQRRAIRSGGDRGSCSGSGSENENENETSDSRDSDSKTGDRNTYTILRIRLDASEII